MENGKRLGLMIDDYTNVHAFRRSTTDQSLDVTHMATIMIRVINQPAIPSTGHQIGPANDTAGVDIDSLVEEFERNMTEILKHIVDTAPPLINVQFFT